MKGLLLVFLAIIIAGSAGAHHGYAQFDTKIVVTLQGAVTDFHFVNPHCVVEFDVKDAQGQVQSWKGELSSSSHLAPRGWTATTLQPGDQMTIAGYRAKNGAPSLWVTKIALANGQALKLDSGN
jgi:Family of unknown function (DUF6152)